MSQDRHTERLYDRMMDIEPETTVEFEIQARTYLVYEGTMQPDEDCSAELKLARVLLRRAMRLLPSDRA